MIQYLKGQPARIHFRLLNTAGGVVYGVAPGNMTVTVEKADGTVSAVTLDGVNNSWIEVTSGAFLHQGKYDLVLSSSYTDQVGPLVVCAIGGGGGSIALVEVVSKIEDSVWDSVAAVHNIVGTTGALLTAAAAGVADTTPPTISNMVPVAGTQITSSTPLGFDVTDPDSAIAKIFIAVSFPNGSVELAFDGASFRGPYARYSQRTTITNGFHFAVVRDGGWLGAPNLEIYAVDIHGNVST
jgi:hypothetical protein